MGVTTCLDCHRPLSEHWSLAMTDEEMIAWIADSNVCALIRGEVESRIKNLRQSRCALCGRTKPSDPTSKYFQARPDNRYDGDWDGCNEAVGT